MRIWISWVLLAASCWGQALGTWKMIPAKSRQSSGQLAKAITAQYEVHPEAARTGPARPSMPGSDLPGNAAPGSVVRASSEVEIWTYYQVRADGISETTSQTLHFDGKEYPCGDLGLEERPDTVISRKLGARTAEVSYKKSGRVTRRVVRTVSADGKQMTLEVHITPEKGPAAEHWLVFER